MEADILLIEDEAEFADYLKRGLTYVGYRVRLAHSAEEGLEKFDQDRHRLLILDVMLPGMNGMDACRRIREKGFTGPILMLTARNAIPDRVLGLDSGADDYLVKPFAFEELLAHIRTLQRRTGASTSSINFADMELDMGLHAAHRAGKPIPLTRTEFDLLNYFLRHPRQVLTREELILNVWGQDAGIQPNILDVYIARLRRKIGEPPLIHTIYGIGYVLKEETV
jgi:two-component system response regulator MprA